MKVIEKGGKLVTEPKMCFTHVHMHRNIKKWIDPINSNFKKKNYSLSDKFWEMLIVFTCLECISFS